MAKLKEDFPGFAALEAAGEATHAKVWRRIADGTLTEIPGIGGSTAEKIMEAFEEIDTPDHQAEEMHESEDDESRTPASDAARARVAENMGGEGGPPMETGASTGGQAESGTLLNTGQIDSDTLSKAKAEGDKTGAQKNEDIANHALDQPTSTEATLNAQAKTEAQRLALSGAVHVDDPNGPYVSKTSVHITPEMGRIKVLPIAQVSPRKGMEVRDGTDVYAIQEPLGPDSTPADWMRVRNPNTGKPFID